MWRFNFWKLRWSCRNCAQVVMPMRIECQPHVRKCDSQCSMQLASISILLVAPGINEVPCRFWVPLS
jgi:hypothetical protein